MLLSHHSICGRNINNSDFCAHLMELNGLCSVEKIVIGLCFLTFSVGVCVCVRERHRETVSAKFGGLWCVFQIHTQHGVHRSLQKVNVLCAVQSSKIDFSTVINSSKGRQNNWTVMIWDVFTQTLIFSAGNMHCIWVTDVFVAKPAQLICMGTGERNPQKGKKEGYGCAQDLISAPSLADCSLDAMLLFITPTYVEPVFK